MKNRKELWVIFLLIFIIIICFFYILKFNNIEIDKSIYNKIWYNYSITSGNYSTFYIDENQIEYNKSDKDEYNYDNCSKYNYNKRKKIINFDCGNSIQISKIEKNKLILIIDEKKYVFYDNINDTLNYEFESYYGKSVSEYKKEMNRVLDLIKIEPNTMKNLILENEYSKFVFIGNNCSSFECAISLDVIEKWITKTENVYYIDLNDFDQKYLEEINKIDNKFSNNKEDYDRVYPFIIITNNGKIIDKYDFKCDGFDCSKYNENEF